MTKHPLNFETDCMASADPSRPCIKCGRWVVVEANGSRVVKNLAGFIKRCPTAKLALEGCRKIMEQQQSRKTKEET